MKVLTFKYISRSTQDEPASPGPCVGVGVPGLLLHSERRLRQDGAEPGRDVFADVVDLVRVLARAPGTVLVRLVLQDLHPAALAAALLSALLLQDGRATASDLRSPPGGGLLNVGQL